MKRTLILIALAASPVAAQDALTADEFDAYTLGRTLTFGLPGGDPYGVERYMADRQVIWSFLGGECKTGAWYEMAGEICFLYDDEELPHCWQFFEEEDGLRAVFTSDPGSPVLYEVLEGDQPLICPGFGV